MLNVLNVFTIKIKFSDIATMIFVKGLPKYMNIRSNKKIRGMRKKNKFPQFKKPWKNNKNHLPTTWQGLKFEYKEAVKKNYLKKIEGHKQL